MPERRLHHRPVGRRRVRGGAPGAGREESAQTAENLRTQISKSVAGGDECRARVTCSIGGTMFRDEESCESAFERADRLMYSAKQAGRNCVRFEG